ncbi:hypothetical protein BC938DRAFT_470719 [Jimgerdemannia flammicorona]|uniref:CWC16 protein n=1 Tax=Jimgerdemannia flammicorona TaxID=994334 RepID=A0A433QV84_9FUNG|nr:hypothetical protein BC938DRAFT_470719 [Jimgerdemannia flammicorona]
MGMFTLLFVFDRTLNVCLTAGVRFNAEKKKIGMYHSTSIWQFRMKCHLCDNWIEIHTDPKTTQYLVISGARKKIEEWEPEDSEVIKLKGIHQYRRLPCIVLLDEETAEKLAADAFYRLEHTVTDEKKREEALPALTRLQRLNETQWSDPYALSQKLRKKFREDKMLAKMEERVAEEIRDRNSLHIPLLPKSEEDEIKAKTTEFADHVLEQAEKRKLEIAASSIFNQDKKRRRTSGPLDDVRSGTTPRSVVKELGVLATVHTKLKIDPFLSTVGFGRVAQAVRDGDTGNVAADAAGGLVGLVRVKEKAETKALAKTRVTNPRTDIVDKDGVNKSKG